MKKIEQTIAFVVHHTRDSLELCEFALSLMMASCEKDQPLLLEMFFVCAAQDTRDDTLKLTGVLCGPNCWKLVRKHRESIHKKLDELAHQSRSEYAFYQSLWQYLTKDSPFPTPEAKVAAFYICLKSRRLPWFYINKEMLAELCDDTISATSKATGEE